MRFLLITPFARSTSEQEGGGPSVVDPMTDAPDRNRSQLPPLSSRTQSNDMLLRQCWTDYDTTHFTPSDEHAGIRLDLAAKCMTRGHEFVAMEVVVEARRLPDADVMHTESLLSAFAIDFISTTEAIDPTNLLWVARYALLPSGDDPPFGWLSSDVSSIDISDAAGSAENDISLRLGWGNGAVHGWERLSEDQQKNLVRGIIDAQVIWRDIDSISNENLDILFSGMAENRKPRKQAIRQLTKRYSQNSANAVTHQLLYDEVLMKVQGIRREASTALLASWQYEYSSSRMLERNNDTRLLIEALSARISSRYQAAIERTLLFLSMLTIVDISLSLINTSFSGQTTARLHPVGHGIFYVIRQANADVILLCSLVLMFVVSVIFFRRR